jgi:hypothetical protein
MKFAFAGVAVKHFSKDGREFFVNLGQDAELQFMNLPECYSRASHYLRAMPGNHDSLACRNRVARLNHLPDDRSALQAIAAAHVRFLVLAVLAWQKPGVPDRAAYRYRWGDPKRNSSVVRCHAEERRHPSKPDSDGALLLEVIHDMSAAVKIQQYTRIDCVSTNAHRQYQSVECGEAHHRVNARAIAHGAQAGTVAKMGSHGRLPVGVGEVLVRRMAMNSKEVREAVEMNVRIFDRRGLQSD